jgi:hypothetical protein
MIVVFLWFFAKNKETLGTEINAPYDWNFWQMVRSAMETYGNTCVEAF